MRGVRCRFHAVFFFIELGSKRVHLAGCSQNPTGAWTAQQARNFSYTFAGGTRPALRFLIDRDAKFTRAFDEVFHTEGIRVIHTPVRAPSANAFAERFAGTVRRECLDWLLIINRRQLEGVLRAYIEHYNAIARLAVSAWSLHSRETSNRETRQLS